MSPETVSPLSDKTPPAVVRRARFVTFRMAVCGATIGLLLGLATSILYYRHVARRMNEWQTAAKKAGLRAEIKTQCVVKWLDRYPFCRRHFPAFEPQVWIRSDDQMFTLFGVKPQCPTRLRIHCPAGHVRQVVLVVAKKALDIEVNVYGDNGGFGGRRSPFAPFTNEERPWMEE